ncbi:MAG: dihydropteroate synthase [Burkholderiales bacterium]|jgi:dihydropteroate synthase|nr:dihydropteroate synthase [Burkholderiales bacterium]
MENIHHPSLCMLGRSIALTRPWVMGIINVTPDSFSEHGAHFDFQRALTRALTMIDDGADMIDIGGESSRPGASPVSEEEELRRILPLTETLAKRGVYVSVDTVKPEVMRQAALSGAAMINDINALKTTGALAAAQPHDVAVCLMHMRGEPKTMQRAPHYDDVVREVRADLSMRATVCENAGIARERIVLDPGFGFGKTMEHNLALIRALPELRTLNYPLLVGWSRKTTLGILTGHDVGDRLAASIAAALAAVAQGALIVRVHDVRETVDALKIWNAMTPNT